MFSKHTKILMLTLLSGLALLSMAQANLKWKPMMFDNPGTKRVLKIDTQNVLYYRSLPEKGMIINVKDLSAIEIRSISKAKPSKPQFILKYADKRQTYDLKLLAVSSEYQIYEPVRITLPPNLKSVELICYDRTMYFRAFYPVQIQKKKVPIPSLKIIGFASETSLSKDGKKSKYYISDAKQPLMFQINKGYNAHLYLRAQLTDRKKPVVGVYRDGVLISKITLSTKKTSAYSVEGIQHLTIGKKIDLPLQDKLCKYEVRSLSGHTIIAKPVIQANK